MEAGQRIMRDLANQDRAKVFKKHGARVDAVRESRIERGLDPNQYQAGDPILFYDESKLKQARDEEWLNGNGF